MSHSALSRAIATEISSDDNRVDFHSQTLWYLCRADSPPVTAVLRRVHGHTVVDVTFGAVARQTVAGGCPLEVVQRTERLRTQLEAYGYRRTRPDRRLSGASPRCR